VFQSVVVCSETDQFESGGLIPVVGECNLNSLMKAKTHGELGGI